MLNIVRKEVELCDHFEGFLCISSLAGGTGSGVGAYVTEMLRDHYPSSFQVNQVVWPRAGLLAPIPGPRIEHARFRRLFRQP